MQGSNERTMCCTLTGRGFTLPHRRVDQGLLQRARRALRVARRKVPAGGRNDLVVGQPPVLHHQPVAQAATGRLGQANAVAFIGQLGGHAKGLGGCNGLQPAFHQRHHAGQFDQPGQHTGVHRAAVTLHRVTHQGRAAGELAGDGPRFHHLAAQAWGFVPGVGTGFFGLGAGQAVQGMQRLAGMGQPGMGGIFCDGAQHQGFGAGGARTPHATRQCPPAARLGVGPVTQVAAGARAEGLQPKVAHQRQEEAEVATHATGPTHWGLRVPVPQRSLAVERGHGFQRGGKQLALQKAAELAHLGQQAHALGRVDGTGRSAGLHRLRVGPFATQGAQQREPALACGGGLAHLLARLGVEPAQGLGMPGPAGVHRAHEVGHEEQVEVREVVGQVLGGQHQVGGVLAVGRHHQPAQIGQRTGRCHRLRHRANAANARHVHQRIVRGLALQNLLEAPVHGGVDVRRGHAAIVHVQHHFQIPFHPVEGANQQATHAWLISTYLDLFRLISTVFCARRA
jgi:hypothetical protein